MFLLVIVILLLIASVTTILVVLLHHGDSTSTTITTKLPSTTTTQTTTAIRTSTTTPIANQKSEKTSANPDKTTVTSSTNIKTTCSTSPLPMTTSTELPATTSTELPLTTSTEPQTSTSTVLPLTTSTEPPTSTSTELPATTSTELPLTTSTELPLTTSTELPLTTSTELPTTTYTELPTTTYTELPTSTSTELALSASTYTYPYLWWCSVKIALVFENRQENQEVISFVRNHIYNSPNYDFAGPVQAINVPYGNTTNYGSKIMSFGDAKSYNDLQHNIDTLYADAPSYSFPDVSDGLVWIDKNIDPPEDDGIAVVIVVGYNVDEDPGGTHFAKEDLVSNGYQFISVSVGPVVPSSTSYPSPLCAYPFTGKIATVFEMKKDTANVTLAEAFVKNYLYNSPNYNFADVTQAINVPYGSTNQYGTSILNFGDARSLTDLQKNIDVLYNSSTSTSVAEVEEGLSWIENNIDPPAAGSIAIVIVVGFNNDNNPGGTYFVKNDLVAEGYQFMAVSLGGDLRNIVDNLDWYFQVNQLNGQDVANQISYILCNL
ncbi:hypothetical protein B9Z55_005049 [Caenorhabditis nigoni]|uniref:VWFA domain-containing protein n=1 Tax=Caenorhabditis nigoni TaxID=1611254 RepID=A0A2G5UZ64_9PELO|nr:hypothetical protein B9Z55_005049 [Caenorhabditis nigoni]